MYSRMGLLAICSLMVSMMSMAPQQERFDTVTRQIMTGIVSESLARPLAFRRPAQAASHLHRQAVERGVARQQVEMTLVGQVVGAGAGLGAGDRQLHAGRAWPQPCSRLTTGIISLLAATSTSTLPTRERTRTRCPSTRPRPSRSRGCISNW